MSSPLSSCARTLRLAGLCLVLTACITDLRVGIERDVSRDASVPDDDGPDAGDETPPEPCVPDDCGALPADAGIECPLLVPPEWVCERNDDDVCEWQPTGGCDDPNAPCQESDCNNPLLITPDRLACSDGTPPMCARDLASGLCTYQCLQGAACGTENGAGCASGEYCWFSVGLCGAGNGGQCLPLPASCDHEDAQVCGCDGQTYANACEAARLGVNIAFAGNCLERPQLCETCEGPAPDPNRQQLACDDGVHQQGANCVYSIDGMCHWQWLECPDTRDCASSISDPIMPGRCFGPEDCAEGETCEGASLCPCDAECFAPDTPGYCKSH